MYINGVTLFLVTLISCQ